MGVLMGARPGRKNSNAVILSAPGWLTTKQRVPTGPCYLSCSHRSGDPRFEVTAACRRDGQVADAFAGSVEDGNWINCRPQHTHDADSPTALGAQRVTISGRALHKDQRLCRQLSGLHRQVILGQYCGS